MMHSKLRRRHTWPFELLDIETALLADSHQNQSGNAIHTENQLLLLAEDHEHEENETHLHQLHLNDHNNTNSRRRNGNNNESDRGKHHLILRSTAGEKKKDLPHTELCTCKSKSGLETTTQCNSRPPDHHITLTTGFDRVSSSLVTTTTITQAAAVAKANADGNWMNGKPTDKTKKLSESSCSPQRQPIEGKFSFLSKKSRDSRKRKAQKEKAERIASQIQHQCNHPSHKQVIQVKSISPTRKSDSSSILTSKSEINNFVFSTSSNNPTPSHTSSIRNENVTIASENSKSSQKTNNSGHTNNILNAAAGVLSTHCMNAETEGKIPSNNGTATGALSLQVNTPNGDVRKVITLWQNYYPEGQWGWIVVFCALIVQAINHGLQCSFSAFSESVETKFQVGEPAHLGWLGSLSVAVSLFLSPLWISICKRKSTRLAAVFGGLVASLGCLFTSFASQFHQLFLSYGLFIGIGVGLTRDASSLMVGQYFKRKRELVEIVVVSGTGLGILLMSVSLHTAINSLGWRLGLQAITGSLFLTFFLGTCYRSASLYHPQRRAILHLKNQKKKVKDLNKREEKPPFLDYSCLKSKTLQILLLSCAFTAFGINTPLFYLSLECRDAEVDDFSFLLLHMYVGAAWIVGCCLFGLIVVQKNQECRVSKQYLCQVASVICGISVVALTAVKGFSGLVIFTWVYGFSLGGYNYALKVYTYERVRARHFPRAWGFIQSSQALPILFSIPLNGYMNAHVGKKSGYYMSALAVFAGSAFLFLTDVRRRRLSRNKTQNSSMKTCETVESAQSPKMRRLSFAFPPMEQMSPQSKHDSGDGQGSTLDPALLSKELTCISEEGMADIDFQDIYFEDWAEYLGGDCITSCNKVENCLVSEYDPDFPMLLDRRTRRWSAARNSLAFSGHVGIGATAAALASGVAGVGSHLLPQQQHQPEEIGGSLRVNMSAPREIPVFRSHPWNTRAPTQRSITVIDEASV